MNAYQLLLNKWQKDRPNYKKFCSDEILVPKEWETSKSKILFLLKETYADFIDITGELGPKGTSKTFWRKMKLWTYVIDELIENRNPDPNKIGEIKEEPNDTIAYVNLKKNVEEKANPYSEDTDIMQYVENDKEYLVEQIKMINPKIILCRSTFKFAQKLYPNFQPISDKVTYADRMLFIDYLPPSNRQSYVKGFSELSNIVKTALTKLKDKSIFEN